MSVNLPTLPEPWRDWINGNKPTKELYDYFFKLDAYQRDVDRRLVILEAAFAGAPNPIESLIVAASDETSAISIGVNKLTYRMPYAFTLTEVRGSLTTAQVSGSIFTVDINESGSSILSTKLTIDNTEKTSTTAAIPVVISDTSLANDSEITIDVDQIGNGTAKGLKVALIGRRA